MGQSITSFLFGLDFLIKWAIPGLFFLYFRLIFRLNQLLTSQSAIIPGSSKGPYSRPIPNTPMGCFIKGKVHLNVSSSCRLSLWFACPCSEKTNNMKQELLFILPNCYQNKLNLNCFEHNISISLALYRCFDLIV